MNPGRMRGSFFITLGLVDRRAEASAPGTMGIPRVFVSFAVAASSVAIRAPIDYLPKQTIGQLFEQDRSFFVKFLTIRIVYVKKRRGI